MNITTVFDQSRGCGDRKEGGLYMMGGEFGETCLRMPIALDTCPCCGQSVLGATGKPSRGLAWIDIRPFIERTYGDDAHCGKKHCNQCPVGGAAGRHILIWIGEKHYPYPADFIGEANRLKINGDPYGISRRISGGHIPKGFEIGKTWVLLAHRKAIPPVLFMGDKLVTDKTHKPGIFSSFKPDRIEYVVRGDESEDELESLEKKGVTLVKVIHLGEQLNLTESEGEDDE